jgi:hypothetical protein
MSRFLPLCLLLALSASLSAQTVSRLQRVAPGATLIVETSDPGGPIFERCKLLSVDASTLTCLDLEQGDRLVFPFRQLDAVYEIHKSHAGLIAGWIAVTAILGILIAGAATGNVALDFLVLLILGVTLTATQTPSPYNRPIPPRAVPWNHGETGHLVYLRPIPVPWIPPESR